MRDEIRAEVDRNYAYFQRNLAALLTEHAGQYALLKSRAIVGFYDGPGVAYRAGLARFPERIFSIQQVTGEPGCMSIAIA
jgi:hypothetical protein